MEFTRELMVMDEVLSDISKSEGDISKPSQCEEGKIFSVVKLLKDKISTNKLQEDKMCSMQKVHFYLLLKCDLKVSNLLENDFDIGHIVERMIYPTLFLRIVWELRLEKYFYESVVHCPPVLSNELLEVAIPWMISHFKNEDSKDVTKKLAEAVYLKMLRIENNTETIDIKHHSAISSKLYEHFAKLAHYLEVLLTDDSDIIIFAKSLICILRLLKSCLAAYLGDCLNFSPQLYRLDLSYDYTSKWPLISSENAGVVSCSLYLVDISVRLFENLSVDFWCSFSEYDSYTEGKSLQKVIGEEIYECLPLLNEMICSGKCTGPKVEVLILMLNTMAIKPWDEDDEIKIATLEDVVNNVYDQSKSQKKWLNTLLQFDVNVFSNASCLGCLEKNVQLLEFQHVALILQNVLHTLRDDSCSKSDDYEERLKRVVFSSIRQFPVKEQLQVMESYFKEFKINKSLCTTNFRATVTEVFNKAVCNEGGDTDKFIAECITLCFQSPRELMTRLLSECLSNAHLTTLMVETLTELRFVAAMKEEEVDEEGNVTSTSNCLIADLLLELMDRPVWSEQELDNFPHMIKLLTDNSIAPEKCFLVDCLLPAIHKTLERNEWNMLCIWLRTLSELQIKECNLNMGSILVILARVLELSRCDMKSFTVQAATVSEVSIKMIDLIIQDICVENYDGKLKKWLINKLSQPALSPINQSYFLTLSRTDKIKIFQGYKWDSILFNVIQNGIVSSDLLEMLKNAEDKDDFRMHLWGSLLKVLPLLTATEWRNLTGMKELFPDFDEAGKIMLLFDILTESLLFWFLYADIELSEDVCVLSCLKYCVQNFGSILQQELLPNVHHLSSKEMKTVFEKIIFVVEKSPEQIKELWSLLLVPVLTEIMSATVSSVLQSDKQGSKIKVCAKEMCCAISISSNPGVRLALARQLAELLH